MPLPSSLAASILLVLATIVAHANGTTQLSLTDKRNLIHHTAHDVAQAMCPYPLTQEYGCPVNASQRHRPTMHSTRQLRDRLMKEAADKGFRYKHFTSADERLGTSDPGAINATTSPLAFFNPGSVPVGVGFDITTMAVRLPYFYPFSLEGKPVFQSTVEHETFNSIEEYAASNEPHNAKVSKATVGTYDADMNKVHGTYFGSRSSFHRTLQKDIVNHLELDMDLLHPLPYVQWMADFVLPLTLIDDNKAIYQDFISNWGTHIVTKAAIGGICEQQLSVSACYVKGHADTLHNIASLHLAKTTKQITKATFNEDWHEHVSIAKTKMWGGDPTLLDMSQWPEREKTLLTAPVLVEVEQLVPIWAFFNHSTAVQANLKTVIDEYVQTESQRRAQQLKEIREHRSYQVTATGQTRYSEVKWTIELQDTCPGQCYQHQDSDFQGNIGHTHWSWCGPGGWTGVMPVQNYSTMTLSPTSNAQQSAPLANSYVYSNCETLGGVWSCLSNNIPAPATSYALTVTCGVDNDGNVTALDVDPTSYLAFRGGRIPSNATTNYTTPGQPTRNGCSKIEKTFVGGVYLNYLMAGNVTFEGWCCVNTGDIVVQLQQMCMGPMVDPTGSCPSLKKALDAPGYRK